MRRYPPPGPGRHRSPVIFMSGAPARRLTHPETNHLPLSRTRFQPYNEPIIEYNAGPGRAHG